MCNRSKLIVVLKTTPLFSGVKPKDLKALAGEVVGFVKEHPEVEKKPRHTQKVPSTITTPLFSGAVSDVFTALIEKGDEAMANYERMRGICPWLYTLLSSGPGEAHKVQRSVTCPRLAQVSHYLH